MKIVKYREKREKRNSEKKVSYDCRKITAENRLRIKGRFIRKEDQHELMKQLLSDNKITDQNEGN